MHFKISYKFIINYLTEPAFFVQPVFKPKPNKMEGLGVLSKIIHRIYLYWERFWVK